MIVVGHSLNGLILPLVAARRPVAAIVYLSGFIPRRGQEHERPVRECARADPDVRRPPATGRPGALALARRGGRDGARSIPDLTPEDAAWAFAQLRPQAPTSQREPHPSGLPPVRAVAIIGARDAGMNPAWSRRVARERLGADAVELDTGHFPMITEPEALADALDAVSSDA